MRLRLVILLLAIVMLTGFFEKAMAFAPNSLESRTVTTPHVSASLTVDRTHGSEKFPLALGVALKIVPGWHIYGPSPGDAGLPPEIKISTTPHAVIGPIQWPLTADWQQGGLTAHVYNGDVTFPFTVTPGKQTDHEPFKIDAEVSWLVCKDICVPESVLLHGSIPWATIGQTEPAHENKPLSDSLDNLRAGGETLTLFLLACAGGLLLNLMPCVFPVLAMKAIGIARLSGAQETHVRRQSGLYAAGIIVSFVGLGCLLAGLRSLGIGLGWGGQFQHPAFVACVAWLLFILGLSLSGLLPLEETGLLRASSWGKNGDVGSFMAGALAVIVAAPCTGPFMGAAMLAAMTGPTPFLILSMLAMGVGMALPGGLLAAFPAYSRFLPRPGPWMVELKQFLAFPMYASALWLIWVLDRQAGSAGLIDGLAGLWCIGLAVWAIHASIRSRGIMGRRAFLALAILFVASPMLMIPSLKTGILTSDTRWERFSPPRLVALRAENRPVLVDITASWCLICLANERIVLDAEPTRSILAHRNVALLKGDWTNGDPILTNFLRQNGRNGVPLYLYYPPGRAPIMLSQILTSSEISKLFPANEPSL